MVKARSIMYSPFPHFYSLVTHICTKESNDSNLKILEQVSARQFTLLYHYKLSCFEISSTFILLSILEIKLMLNKQELCRSTLQGKHIREE